MTAPDQTTVRRDADAYVLELDGRRVGAAFFTVRNRILVFTHTEVDDELSGQHLGSRLVEAAFDDVRQRGERIIARCPFVAVFVQRHPDYADLLA